MADKPISDPLCRNIGNIISPSRFFFPTVNLTPANLTNLTESEKSDKSPSAILS